MSSVVPTAPAPVAEAPTGNAIVRFFKSHPKGFYFFFWGEFAERCSYYGMRAILAKYMADQLNLGQDNAATYMSFFIAACYLLPLVGGWVADNYFGKYWTIVGFSIPYILGHVILGVESFFFLVIALVLLAMGAGVIKPNISTLMGLTYDQQRPGQTKLRSDAFAIFYFSINIGAAISQAAMPPIRTKYGYAIAFLFPAALMVVAFIIFAAGKKYYGVETISRHTLTPEQNRERWVTLKRVFGLFFLVMFFWGIFDQAASTWIFFAEACMDCQIFGMRMDPDQTQSFNSILILLMLPPITMSWRWLDNKGYKVRPTDKMVIGFVLTTVCMAVMSFSALSAGSADSRPGIFENKEDKTLKLTVSNAPPLEGRLKVAVAGDNKLSITQIRKEKQSDGKEKEVKDSYTLTGAENGLLKLKAEGEKKIVVVGDIAKFEKTDGDKKETLAEGSLTAVAEGEMKVSNRWFVDPENKVTLWWMVIAYIVITIAEILISVTGLELAYTAAPKSMTSFVTACWLFTVFLANFVINAPVTRLYPVMQPVVYFGILTAIMFAVSIAFVFVAKRFNQQQPQSEGAAAPH